jgi:MOB kinase activator 1
MAVVASQSLRLRTARVSSPVCTLLEPTSHATGSFQPSQTPHAACVPPCSQEDDHSNQRTRNQFRPRNATKGTTSYQLRQYAEATLGGGSLRKIVRLPEGEDENEWLAVNSREI